MLQLPPWAWTWIAVSVTATWVVLNLIDAFSTTYAVDPGLHIVMGSVTGGSAANAYLSKRRKEEPDG